MTLSESFCNTSLRQRFYTSSTLTRKGGEGKNRKKDKNWSKGRVRRLKEGSIQTGRRTFSLTENQERGPSVNHL